MYVCGCRLVGDEDFRFMCEVGTLSARASSEDRIDIDPDRKILRRLEIALYSIFADKINLRN